MVSSLYRQPLLSFSSVQSLSHVRLFETPRTTARQVSLSITGYLRLFKLMCIESVMPSSHLILCLPLLPPPLIFPSITDFSSRYQMVILSCLSVNLLNGFDFPNAVPMILSHCVYHFTKTQLPKSQSWIISTPSCILPHCFLKLFSKIYQTEVSPCLFFSLAFLNGKFVY